jgi:hypothetical protein
MVLVFSDFDKFEILAFLDRFWIISLVLNIIYLSSKHLEFFLNILKYIYGRIDAHI